MKNIILSICIPTYNRCECLEKTLTSIVSQKVFKETNDIEIVVCDNASTDDTQNVVKKFIKEYKDKIIYIKNKKNVHSSENFFNVLNAAKGEFCKLQNDTLKILPEKLLFIVDFIKANLKEKPVLFFLNSDSGNNYNCDNLNSFIENISYLNTWIGSFGLWKKDKSYFVDFISQRDSCLAQSYILCKLITDGNKVVIGNDLTFSSLHVVNKGGYNIAEVFGRNYLNILKKFVENKSLSQKVYEKEKKLMLTKHINHFYFDIKKNYNFNKTGYFNYLWEDYKFEPYFYLSYIKEHIKYFKNIFKCFEAVLSVKSDRKDDKKRKKITFLGMTFYGKWKIAKKRGGK